MIDIYFEPNYGKTTENIEKGICETFRFENDLGVIRHMYIKREIPIKVNGDTYYDLITPYGYGGPIIEKLINENKKQDLADAFYESFKQHCLMNNIVSEFVRFHPIVGNHKDFKDVYQVDYLRNTLGTNLKDYDDPFMAEFSKSGRSTTRRAIRDGVTFEIVESPTDLEKFKKIYYSTMDRNKATDFYYFDEEYFVDLLKYLRKHIVVCEAKHQDKTIAMSIYFKYNNFLHMHLSGTQSKYLSLSPAYVLQYGMTKWGKDNGYELIHHGGGTTNSEKDGLYRFKKRFANNTEFEFYIGKKVWNKEIYDELCNLTKQEKYSNFFPSYRNK